MKKRRAKALPILLIVIVVAAAGAWFALSGKQDKVDYITETARVADIRKVVNATGEVGAVQLVSVGAQASGQIEKLYVSVGQQVRKGDPIADIDSTTQRNDLDINKAKLDTYQAQLAAKQVALKVAQTQYNREAQLRKTNSTSRESLEDAENALATAKAAVAELESQIRQAQIAVNTAETNLGYTKISAPLDGTVVAVPVEEGQTVNANQTTPTIVQIADLSHMEIKIEIAEGDITQVKPGMTVDYTILAEPGATRRAVLDSIDPGLTTLSDGTYDTSSGSSSSDSAVYYYAKAVVPNPDGALRIGMTTQNVIVVESADQVTAVPSIAVFTRPGGEDYVRLLRPDGSVEERTVETGLSNNMLTEIRSGLQAGDRVVSAQMTQAEAAARAGSMRGPRR
ncbi:MAG: efflux transporter periplasmic adaptor subunit [Desulfovibrionaceae bacterium]|nr:efflux RND transporter periplasmic adaptor subunit [Desulfovibrionaceae bacterium]PWM65511.1 MAG: efflux transporter periplasmic adaptor subunit [Desulfovibrionaceae bacterium]